MRLEAVSPTGSYTLLLPSVVAEDVDDESIFSFWVPADETLLQLSSMRRERGAQVGATERLRDRLKLGELRSVRIVPLALTGCEDVAAAAGLDDEDTAWLYVYAVWPNVSLFVTISHPRELPERSWALDALHSLRAGSLLDA